MESLAFHTELYNQMKDDYTTNSHYLSYTFLFNRKVGKMYFLNLGVKGLYSCGLHSTTVQHNSQVWPIGARLCCSRNVRLQVCAARAFRHRHRAGRGRHRLRLLHVRAALWRQTRVRRVPERIHQHPRRAWRGKQAGGTSHIERSGIFALTPKRH